MKLSVKDRLVFNGLYPQQSNIITQTLVQDIEKKVALTQIQMTLIGLKQRIDGPGLQWDDEIKIAESFLFTDAELTFLQSQVNKLDKENKITQELLPICLAIQNEKFHPKEVHPDEK